MISRCLVCNGRKTVMSLGGMRKECDECHGIGHVSISESTVRENRTIAKMTEAAQNSTNKENLTVRIRKDGSPKRAYNRKVKVG